ncbi:3-hydroxybutyryl-CoA dehydrogenase [Mycobacterium triplex]|uniref:3-hydroxybutyryl-CoA dehydrogenase n=3 Tax=Mycobacterium simiae complex TaxID=2249310 RepID=A0A024K7W7_9MYCO|nr:MULTISPECIES: 3-hydroxyacyl-CoA dehydrogenase family protein [Mycobacterium simiae complex]ORJ53875.1 3-hydroxybutyryl-CoA dehydrogenase [Mycobacterium simiae]ORX07608.1 3-hydroxybutyryl-CoA dehydrogenase [Mycobacterium triplex]CDO91563.1 putative 3-hydroxyacyl-CoA dehydrogenase [Mycobacterium triplex]SOX57010.1 3-hydroxybutyryl-CoA dehydrogenase [Mycobacterium ahvazicum]
MVQTIGVIGAGTMGIGIAYVFAASGSHVTIVEPDPERAQGARTALIDQAAAAHARGKLNLAAREALGERLRFVLTIAELPDALDLAVEAVPERVDLKRLVLAEAEKHRPALLATNTSGITIGELAGALNHPQYFLGLHFFNPVWSMPLVEIVRGRHTHDTTVTAAEKAVTQIGKERIVVADTPGFATSRLGVAIGLEAMRMFEDGVASAEDIDRAMELGYRHPMGPIKLTDLVGLDVRLDIATNLADAYGPRFDPPQILRDKVAAGELGRKTGRGFYNW